MENKTYSFDLFCPECEVHVPAQRTTMNEDVVLKQEGYCIRCKKACSNQWSLLQLMKEVLLRFFRRNLERVFETKVEEICTQAYLDKPASRTVTNPVADQFKERIGQSQGRDANFLRAFKISVDEE